MAARIRIRDGGGTLRTLARVRMRDGEGQLRTIQRIRIRDASNVLRTVWEAMTAALSPTSISETGSTSTITTLTSCTATPTGGTAPYSYGWFAADYNTDNIGISSPTSATTTFRRTGCLSGDTYQGDFWCTVTDATGVVAYTGMVSVVIQRT